MKKYLLAIMLVMPLSLTAQAQDQMSGSGQVVSVRLLTRTMTVRDATAKEVIRYNVPMAATVTLAGQPGRFGLLRAGDTVNVNYVNTDEGREAVRVRVPEPTSAMDMRIAEGPMSTITGRVESLNSRNRTITVLGDQSGQRFTYAVPEGTRVTIGGENARMGLIERGDNVTLRFKEEDAQRQVARVRVPQPATPLTARSAQPAPAVAVAQSATPTQLPRTASFLPLFGIFGVLSLFAAGSLRLTRRSIRKRS